MSQEKQEKVNVVDLALKKGMVCWIDVVPLLATLAWPIVAMSMLHWPLLLTAVFNVIILLFWLVILVYRLIYFVALVQLSLDMMPATSARLAVRFLKTQPTNMTDGA